MIAPKKGIPGQLICMIAPKKGIPGQLICMIAAKKGIPGQLSSSREELPVSEGFLRVRIVLKLRHRSLVGLCERMPVEVFFLVRYGVPHVRGSGIYAAVHPYR